MPPKITRVKWSAKNLPYGMEFSEVTGTFFGKPEVVGEYTVPVTVETNYGKDTKDIKIVINPPSLHGLFIANGYNSSNGLTNWNIYDTYKYDDANFFRKIDTIPNPCKLVAHANGRLGVLTESGDYYCQGMYANQHKGNVYTAKLEDTIDFMGEETSKGVANLYDTIKNWAGNALTLEDDEILSGVDRVFYVSDYTTIYYSSMLRPKMQQYALVLWNSKLNKAIIYPTRKRDFSYETVLTGSGKTVKSTQIWTDSTLKFDFSGVDTVEAFGEGSVREYSSFIFLTEGNTKLGGVDLGYKAIKFFPYAATKAGYPSFKTLSEDHYFDNKSETFTHGIIKNAWVYGLTVFVQTMENQLYLYRQENKSWDYIGAYDVKKVEFVNGGITVYLLTNNGELYVFHHYVKATTDANGGYTVTRMFPLLNLVDVLPLGTEAIAILVE
ncbi:MAG: putative Ig domain-containing protein [Synergistaceae bacterium]|nr:putative Ig domain-containing protein [Synergistaceae bacterium]